MNVHVSTTPNALISLHPSWWLAFVPRRGVVIAIIILIAGYFAVRAIWPSPRSEYLLLFAALLLLAEFIRGVLMVTLFRYTLTTTHISATIGILQRQREEIALTRVQRIGVHQTLIQRICGVGNLDVAAADGLPVIWYWIANPESIATQVRDAVASSENIAPSHEPTQNNFATPHLKYTPSPSTLPTMPFMTIGLVGGIGAGKSAVAKILSDLGYVVLDADKDAKAALDLPNVRDQLVSWWSSEILDATGKVDRKKLAAIVFQDQSQRKRLEALVHPIVTSTRAAAITTAKREGKPGVVVDAPLLFEAGSDKDCDAVLFVDAPRNARLTRVLERGWTEDEFNRREVAQMSLDEKRQRSDAVIVNDADLPTLRDRTTRAIHDLRQKIT